MTVEELLAAVPAGWRGLVERLLDEMGTLNVEVKWNSVGERAGSLAFHFALHGADWRRASDAIAHAERSSASICERCAAPGRLRTVQGRQRTLCDACRNHPGGW
jgi:hypothetical protein